MRTIQFIFILTLSLFLGSGPTEAQVVFGDPTMPNMATGINNLEVGGINYNVVFRLQKFANEIYGPFPGTFDIFDALPEAEDAVATVNLALNGANATSIGDIDLPGFEGHSYLIGFESFILPIGEVESILTVRATNEGTTDWFSLGENPWTYNFDERNWAVFSITTAVDDDDVVDIPEAYKLFPNYPNPFNPTTTIQYYLPQASEVTVRIFDVYGNLVKTLVNGRQSAGQKSAIWNGHNDIGQKVSSGVYFYSLITEEFLQSKKMMLLK
jgi:hypothetical protein